MMNEYDAESEPLLVPEERDAEWDIFREELPQSDVSSTSEDGSLVRGAIRLAKLLVCLVTFLLVLGGAVVAKASTLFITSQLRVNASVQICPSRGEFLHTDPRYSRYEAVLPAVERVAWVWVLLFALLIPELGTLVRCVRIIVFKPKSWKLPTLIDLAVVAGLEICGATGVAILGFSVLPDLDVLSGVMLTNCLAHVPLVLGLLRDIYPEEGINTTTEEVEGRTRKTSTTSATTSTASTSDTASSVGLRSLLLESRSPRMRLTRLWVGGVALGAQVIGLIAWPLERVETPSLWLIPVAVLLISCSWWENYLPKESPLEFFRFLAKVKSGQERSRYPTYLIVSVAKMMTFFVAMMVIWSARGEEVNDLFALFHEAFSPHRINITETIQLPYSEPILKTSSMENLLPSPTAEKVEFTLLSVAAAPKLFLLVQIVSAYITYIAGKYACRILVQGFSYAAPVTMAVPATLCFLIIVCGQRFADPCVYEGVLPNYLFFNQPSTESFKEFFSVQSWLWLLWLASQAWASLHIWWPRCQRLASTEKIFVTPLYSTLLVDQSLAFNRRIDDQPDKERTQEKTVPEPKVRHRVVEMMEQKGLPPFFNEEEELSVVGPGLSEDAVPKIFACATMWHETREEMIEVLKSIMRMDEDQSAHRCARNYFLNDSTEPPKDYYEYETHIFFDDAFVAEFPPRPDSRLVNSYVREFLRTIDEAASRVHETHVRLLPPKAVPTPYGGRLVYRLPGQTHLIVHLKDSAKIRHKKRWSQVMYMYYLLGFKLLSLPVSARRKDVIAENTYLLALDGDIDFHPAAVHKLVDLMKKDRNLGAACGRIHPVGSGAMQWYQKFEYAVGHWLQKATEHVIGCVLCSPGCFSLFRGSALMDTNVMRKYTTMSEEARHYVQYDQGEDRWLCTLLLQRGYRVEYSAASDALTHCPESFNEFYNQRRRWVPSTMANILDLLADYKHTVSVNDSISMLYIVYQMVLMVGSILGPGTILLLLMGAFVTVFGWSDGASLTINVVPVVIFMVICYNAKNDTQIFIAAIYSVIYSIVMLAVLIGILVQIAEDGPLAPSSLFFFVVSGQLIIAALLHPRELDCLPAGVIYFITVPSMYMLLIIYSLFNLNNVSWGTREVPKPPEAQQTSEHELAAANRKAMGLKDFIPSLKKSEDSSENKFQSLVNLLFSRRHSKTDEQINMSIVRVAESLELINNRMDRLENHKSDTLVEETNRRQPTTPILVPIPEIVISKPPVVSAEDAIVSETVQSEVEDDDLYWIENDPQMKQLDKDCVDDKETNFWERLIKKYLKPIEKDSEKQKRVAKELKDLRDKMVFGFFMLNALFVCALFLVHQNRKIPYLSFDWPLRGGRRTQLNVTRNSQQEWHVNVTTNPVKLEPIGMLFLFSFSVVLFIQFVAMLYHRFGTFTHILATSSLDLFCEKKERAGPSHLVVMAREMQRLRPLTEEAEEERDLVAAASGEPEPSAGPRRHSIAHLERLRLKPQPRASLAEAFERRVLPLDNVTDEEPPVRALRRLSQCPKTVETVLRRAAQNSPRKSWSASSAAPSESELSRSNLRLSYNDLEQCATTSFIEVEENSSEVKDKMVELKTNEVEAEKDSESDLEMSPSSGDLENGSDVKDILVDLNFFNDDEEEETEV